MLNYSLAPVVVQASNTPWGVMLRSGKENEKNSTNPYNIFQSTFPVGNSLFVPATEAASANPAVEPAENIVNQAISVGNLLSSDFSKTVLNLWRLGLVDMSRWLDTVWRGFAQLPMQYIQEFVRQSARSHIAPLITADLFPKTNGQRLTVQDRKYYPHLKEEMFEELRQADELYGILDVEKMGGLYDALTDPLRGGRYANIPELLNRFTCELPVLDANKQPTGRFQMVQFAPNSALVTHLKWRLAAKDSLKDLRQNFALLNPAAQYIPFTEFDFLSERSVEQVSKEVLLAHNHLEKFGLIKQVPTLYQFLLQASRGDFETVTGTVNRKLAFDVLSGDTHKEKIDDELPLILGGEGENPAKIKQMILKAWVVKLFKTCEPVNPEQKTNATFGKTADSQVVWKNLWRHLKLGSKDEKEQDFTLRIRNVVEQLFSGRILLKNEDPHKPETLLAYPFKLDAKNELGLDSVNGELFIQESAKALWQLQTVLNDCFDMTTKDNISAEEMQKRATQYLQQFERYNTALALTFPGNSSNAVERGTLQHIYSYYSEARFTESRGKIQNLMNLLNQSQHLTQFRLPTVVKASTLPQLALSMVMGLLVTGVFWNYMDNNVIQPYENKMMEKKGTVEYTGLVLGAAFVPAFLAFLSLNKWDVLKRITGNRPAIQFGVSGLLGLAIQAGLSVAMVRAFLETKPDVPKPHLPTVPGTINAKVDFTLGNLPQKLQQTSNTLNSLQQPLYRKEQWQPLAKQLPYTVAAITETA